MSLGDSTTHPRNTTMKTNILTSVLAIAATVTAHAANIPLTLTGFNTDAVMENNPSHYATSLDGHPDPTGGAFFEAGLGGHADGLPSSRSFTSVAGTLFQLQPYGSNGIPTNNALRLFDGASASLTLTTPVQLSSLSVLAMTASGTGSSTNLPLLITFTDSSTLSVTYSAPDSVAPANGIDGLGRSIVSGTGFIYGTDGNDFGITETLIDLSTTTKPIQSLRFTGANDFTTYTTTNVFAISGSVVPEPTSGVLLLLGGAFFLRRCSLRTHERIA